MRVSEKKIYFTWHIGYKIRFTFPSIRPCTFGDNFSFSEWIILINWVRYYDDFWFWYSTVFITAIKTNFFELKTIKRSQSWLICSNSKIDHKNGIYAFYTSVYMRFIRNAFYTFIFLERKISLNSKIFYPLKPLATKFQTLQYPCNSVSWETGPKNTCSSICL